MSVVIRLCHSLSYSTIYKIVGFYGVFCLGEDNLQSALHGILRVRIMVHVGRYLDGPICSILFTHSELIDDLFLALEMMPLYL